MLDKAVGAVGAGTRPQPEAAAVLDHDAAVDEGREVRGAVAENGLGRRRIEGGREEGQRPHGGDRRCWGARAGVDEGGEGREGVVEDAGEGRGDVGEVVGDGGELEGGDVFDGGQGVCGRGNGERRGRRRRQRRRGSVDIGVWLGLAAVVGAILAGAPLCDGQLEAALEVCQRLVGLVEDVGGRAARAALGDGRHFWGGVEGAVGGEGDIEDGKWKDVVSLND